MHQVTPTLTRASIARRSSKEHNANNNPTSVHLADITDRNTLPQLLRPELYSDALIPDIVHQTYEVEWVVEYAYTATNLSNSSAG